MVKLLLKAIAVMKSFSLYIYKLTQNSYTKQIVLLSKMSLFFIVPYSVAMHFCPQFQIFCYNIYCSHNKVRESIHVISLSKVVLNVI